MNFVLAEKARIEAQIKAAEAASQMKAESELKLQRDREREAARLALQKVCFFLLLSILGLYLDHCFAEDLWREKKVKG